MAKGINRKLHIVIENINKETAAFTSDGGIYAGALSGEGYRGGYRQCAYDVLMALNGITPQTRGWWEKRQEEL